MAVRGVWINWVTHPGYLFQFSCGFGGFSCSVLISSASGCTSHCWLGMGGGSRAWQCDFFMSKDYCIFRGVDFVKKSDHTPKKVRKLGIHDLILFDFESNGTTKAGSTKIFSRWNSWLPQLSNHVHLNLRCSKAGWGRWTVGDIEHKGSLISCHPQHESILTQYMCCIKTTAIISGDTADMNTMFPSA